MARYKLTGQLDSILNTETGAWIPKGHRFWLEYEKWLEEGNTPDPQYNLEQLKSLKVQEFKRAYTASLTTLSVTTNGKTFNIDINEQAQVDWMKLLNLAQISQQPVTIRDADNNNQTLSVSEFLDVVGQIGSYCQGLWATRCSKIDAARQATTEAELNQI